jgi:hypothetical protein
MDRTKSKCRRRQQFFNQYCFPQKNYRFFPKEHRTNTLLKILQICFFGYQILKLQTCLKDLALSIRTSHIFMEIFLTFQVAVTSQLFVILFSNFYTLNFKIFSLGWHSYKVNV